MKGVECNLQCSQGVRDGHSLFLDFSSFDCCRFAYKDWFVDGCSIIVSILHHFVGWQFRDCIIFQRRRGFGILIG